MKSIKFFLGCLTILVLLLTIGCSNKKVTHHNYTFRGQSENWMGEFKVIATETFTKKDVVEYDSESEEFFTLTYKGDIEQLQSVEEFKYRYEKLYGAGSQSKTGPPEKVMVRRTKNKGNAIVRKDEVIKVIVEVDGKTETFELININND